VKPTPTPKPTAASIQTGVPGGAAKARKPHRIIRQMPHTR
jgi:hypothetical protein